ncbi:MAG: RNA-binding protein [Treponema sp.]|jgi:RNA recognition motif-containing protein|nr:RNA-binding protein [Treponema sp.]MBQ4236042.1 RNA-binding protein [Treponema sp.]MBQ5382970.1 RNA-binding protein [Treponema sp.]
MSKRVYAGNLSYITTEETLQREFSKFGPLVSVSLIIDRDTQQSKGFGFIEFENDSDADSAIAAMSGKELDGRRIRVNFAEEKVERKPRNADSERGGSFRSGGERRGRNPRREPRRFNRDEF